MTQGYCVLQRDGTHLFGRRFCIVSTILQERYFDSVALHLLKPLSVSCLSLSLTRSFKLNGWRSIAALDSRCRGYPHLETTLKRKHLQQIMTWTERKFKRPPFYCCYLLRSISRSFSFMTFHRIQLLCSLNGHVRTHTLPSGTA